MKISVIIVAGGSGTRMGSDLPKQFLQIDSRPILMHTIERFAVALAGAEIIVALPESYVDLWKSMCESYGFKHKHQVCVGGDNRFTSVRNALSLVGDCDFVAIHDGVRPLVSKKVIDDAVNMARTYGNAIPVIKPVNSLRHLIDADGESEIVDRDDFREVQTPQVFARDLILRAYEQPYDNRFTDDASVVEALGERIYLSEGSYFNIKVTTPMDYTAAEAIMVAERKKDPKESVIVG